MSIQIYLIMYKIFPFKCAFNIWNGLYSFIKVQGNYNKIENFKEIFLVIIGETISHSLILKFLILLNLKIIID